MARTQIEIPAILQGYMNNLVAEWDDFDIREREKIRANAPESYTYESGNIDWVTKSKMYRTNSEIHDENAHSARCLVESLIRRTMKKVGTITDFSMLTVTYGNIYEGAAINGYIKGESGRVEVRSIIAGGYNIQKRHVRVLVK